MIHWLNEKNKHGMCINEYAYLSDTYKEGFMCEKCSNVYVSNTKQAMAFTLVTHFSKGGDGSSSIPRKRLRTA